MRLTTTLAASAALAVSGFAVALLVVKGFGSLVVVVVVPPAVLVAGDDKEKLKGVEDDCDCGAKEKTDFSTGLLLVASVDGGFSEVVCVDAIGVVASANAASSSSSSSCSLSTTTRDFCPNRRRGGPDRGGVHSNKTGAGNSAILCRPRKAFHCRRRS